MPRILSIHYNGKLSKSGFVRSLMEPFKFFRYLDKFTKTAIIIFILLGLVTPFIVGNYQIFNLKAQHSVEQATLSLSPRSGMLAPNDNFSIVLRISTKEGATAVKTYLDFDPALLKVVS